MQTTPHPAPSVTPSPEAPTDAPTLLARIDERLARLEAVAGRLEALGVDARAVGATASDTLDELAARLGDADARLEALAVLAETLTRPAHLAQLAQLADAVASAPSLFATVGDAVDEIMARAIADGVDPDALGRVGRETLIALARIAPDLDLEGFLRSGMFEPRTVEVLGEAARAIAETGHAPPRRVGALGLLRALADEDVQRAVGFALEVASRFGGALRGAPAPRPLPR